MSDNGRHKACNACRERKIKCDGGLPKCGRCTRCGVQCFYAPPSKRYSKADFASVLETLNNRLLQTEAAVVATAQNSVRPLLTSASPISSMWSSFAPISTPTESPFPGMDYMSGNNLFPSARDFPLPDLSLAEVDNRGNFIFPTNDGAGKAHGLGLGSSSNVAMLSPELSPPTTSNKEFDFSVGVGGDYNQAQAQAQTSNSRVTDGNQAVSGQHLPSPGSSSWMEILSQGSGGHGRRESHQGQPSNQNNGTTTRTDSPEFVDLETDSVRSETAPRAATDGTTATNAHWNKNSRIRQGSSEKKNGFSEHSSETRSLRGEDNQNQPRTSQQSPSTMGSARRSSTVEYSPRYANNETPEAPDDFEYVNKYTVSGPSRAPLKRRRLQMDTTEQQTSQQQPDSQHNMNGGQGSQSRGGSFSHSGRRSSAETYLPSPKLSKPPTPCSSSMRRNIGTGTAFNGLVKLRGTENYPEWSRAIRAAARKEGVWDIMTGQCVSPEPLRASATLAEQQEHQDNVVYWTNKTELALGGLEGSLEDHIQASVDNIECPRTMWLKLERDYKPTEDKTLYNLIQRLDNISLKSCGNVERLATELRQIQDRIDHLKKNETLPGWYFVLRFLHSLGSAYEEFITNLLFDAHKDQEREFSFEHIVAQAIAEEQRHR